MRLKKYIKKAMSLFLAAVMLITSFSVPSAAYVGNDLANRPALTFGPEHNGSLYRGAGYSGQLDLTYVETGLKDSWNYVKGKAKDSLVDGIKGYVTGAIDKLIDAEKAMGEQLEAAKSALKKFKNWSAKTWKTIKREKPVRKYLRNLIKKLEGVYKGASKINKLTKLKTGFCTGVDVILTGLGLKDFMDNPDTGYKSTFFEFCATELRAFSNTFGVIPGVGAILGLLDFIFTSETVVTFVNNRIPSIKYLDKFAEFQFLIYGTMGEYVGMRWFADWWNSGDVKKGEQAYKEMLERLKKAREKYEKEHGVPFSYSKNKAQGATATANNINVYKPNIYLYPDKPTDFDVIFARPELVTVSEPVYDRGWQGTAYPDGTLAANGEEYGFLFYESLTDASYYQFSEGFVIPADAREAEFTDILSAYGLNERERADFIEFWCDKLEEGADYAMYPQLTATIDLAMPISVYPKPDSAFRIWFVFVKDGSPEAKPEPETFAREGYSMVEWGGMIV